jgi:hypothetical protein
MEAINLPRNIPITIENRMLLDALGIFSNKGNKKRISSAITDTVQ